MRSRLTPRRQFVFSIGVLLLAAVVRLWLIAHLPQGLYTDESFYLLRAQEIVRGQALPVYITDNNGVEPLFFYLVAGLLPILGPVNWVGRLAAAWLGLISVAATIRAGKELFPGRFVGTLAGLSLATLLWSLTFSRFGSQQITAATASAGALAAFWHGVRTRSRRAFLLAGLCVGLGLDSYVAFRLFPAVLLAAILALLIARREAWRQWLGGGAITAGAAAIVFAPLAWFFIQNPGWFVTRYNETSALALASGGRLAGLTSNLLKVIGGLFVRGDANWRQNLAYRPALDIVQTLFLGAGGVVAIRQWRRAEVWTLGAWLIIGLAPSVITIDAPHFGRTTMAMPALVLLVALGIDAVWRWGRGRVARTLLVAAMLYSGVLSVYDFFGRWASARQLFHEFSGEQVQLAQMIDQTVPPEANLYLYLTTSNTSPDYSLEYMLDAHHFDRRLVLRGLSRGQNCQYFPPPDAYIAFDDPAAAAQLKTLYPAVTLASGPHAEVEYVPAGQAARWPVDHLRLVHFGDFADMAGYTLTPASPLPGQSLQLKIVWRVNQTTPADYKIFAHLLGSPKADGSSVYAQIDPQPCGSSYPTWQWQPGDVLVATYSLGVPADLPPGSYTLDLGWDDEAVRLRLPVFDEAHQPLGNALTLAQLQINPESLPSK